MINLSDFQQELSQIRNIIIDESASDIPLMQDVCMHLIDNNGKMLRPLLSLAFAQIYDSGNKRDYYLAAAIEMIHIATLLHDDVLDQSQQRRGKSSANMAWGNKPAILAGDYLFAKAFQLLVKTEKIDILDFLSSISAILTEGEILQLAHEGNVKMTHDDYYAVIHAKTSALFEAACCGILILRDKPTADIDIIRLFAQEFGYAFQILDDTLDYDMHNQQNIGKDLGDDLRERKISYPLLCAYQYADNAMRHLIDDYMQDTIFNQQKFDAIFAFISQENIIQQSYDKAEYHCGQAYHYLEKLPITSAYAHNKQKIIDIVRFCTQRRQ